MQRVVLFLLSAVMLASLAACSSAKAAPEAEPAEAAVAAPEAAPVKTYEEGYEAGEKAGYAAGVAEGEASGYDGGYRDGEKKGYRDGKEAGLAEGRALAEAEALEAAEAQANAEAEAAAARGPVSIYSDGYVDISYIGCEEDESGEERIVFGVSNKSSVTLDFQVESLALDGLSLGYIRGSESVAAMSYGNIRFSAEYFFETLTPSTLTIQLSVIDFSKTIFEGMSYDVSLVNVQVA